MNRENGGFNRKVRKEGRLCVEALKDLFGRRGTTALPYFDALREIVFGKGFGLPLQGAGPFHLVSVGDGSGRSTPSLAIAHGYDGAALSARQSVLRLYQKSAPISVHLWLKILCVFCDLCG
ncbi:MAG TPA: hypothetical protein VGY98_07725 [Verrucomicrobiae bacterium]|nr:hypothetical protein [Verrucomicrobiae bacterium]